MSDLWGWKGSPARAMCCICFDEVTQYSAWTDGDGVKWDMCVPCGETELIAEVCVLMAKLWGSWPPRNEVFCA